MSQEPSKITEKVIENTTENLIEKKEKFYQTEGFRNLPPDEKRKLLSEKAQTIKSALNQNYKDILENTKNVSIAVGGAYIGYRLLRWVFADKADVVTKTIIVSDKKQTEKKRKPRTIFSKIQDRVFDFIWDIAIDTFQEQVVSHFFKKKKKKKNGKKNI